MVSAGGEKVPVLVFFLSWLAPHRKHRETSSNYDAKPSSADPYSQPSPTSHQPSTSPVPPLTSPVPSSVPTLQETLQSTSPVSLSSIPAPQESQSSQPSSSCGPAHSFTSSDTSASWPETPQLLFSSPQGASASPAFVPPRSPQSRPGKKRKNRDQDDWFIERMKQLEGRLLEVQKAMDNNDEYSRFGQTVADMLRRVPEDNRGDAMFAVYRVSICGRTHRTEHGPSLAVHIYICVHSM
ncbi:chromatin-remodeling ATPase INO80-like [Myripristis murdjan]|uniref:chromatin-remodeling ATPase INO80-like n=1 Tax=Myripristis murdjan TaxID=586833 RepID=UPI001175DFD9|nr:chromatin-remodeling ATPase INO80-like [Myripristis murdjan]